MQIEHVKSAETVIEKNYWKTEKIGMKTKRTKRDEKKH